MYVFGFIHVQPIWRSKYSIPFIIPAFEIHIFIFDDAELQSGPISMICIMCFGHGEKLQV